MARQTGLHAGGTGLLVEVREVGGRALFNAGAGVEDVVQGLISAFQAVRFAGAGAEGAGVVAPAQPRFERDSARRARGAGRRFCAGGAGVVAGKTG